MNFSYPQIVMQEIPGEISLALSISGCPLRCPGCHSAFTWDAEYGDRLNEFSLQRMLDKYEGMISCVLFYGGEWEPDSLIHLLSMVRNRGLLTALYSGHEQVDDEILACLDFLKLGRYIADRGGLESTQTNQRLVDLRTGQCLNAHFVKDLGVRSSSLKKAG